MADDRRPGFGEGIRTGIGVFTAFKEAVEETLQEAMDRGDFSQERAKATIGDAIDRLQVSFDEVRDRLDIVTRREFEELRREITALRDRVDRLEGDGSGMAAAIPVD